MKKLLLASLLLPALALAEPLSLNFREVPVVSFAESTYKSILGRDLLIEPDVLGINSRITLSIKSIERDKLPALLSGVLETAGIRARDANGMIRLQRLDRAQTIAMAYESQPIALRSQETNQPSMVAMPPAQEPEPVDHEVYRPQNRPVEYLQAALRFAGLGNGQSSQGQSQLDVMVISGTEEQRIKLRKLIADLDTPPKVINVRAALVEFSDTTNSGWNVGGVLSLLSEKLDISANAGATAANFARFKTGSIDSLIGVMSSDSRFHFRSQPSIRLIDGEQGRLQIGSDVPVRGALTITQSGQQVQATEYKPSGLVLSVLPRVLDGRVQARLVQEISSFSKTNTSGIDSPTLNKRALETTVDAEDGEVVVLAGLDEESTTEGQSGPFDWLPLSRSRDKRNTQLLVLLEFQRL